MKIAFGHRKRVGKDTACDYIATKLTNVLRLSFAGPIYTIHDLVLKTLGRPIEKNRGLLRALGQWGREEDPMIWINFLVQAAINHPGNVVVSDLRFLNEAEKLKEAGFILVKISRPGIEKDDDISETALSGYDGWDYKIKNDGDLEKFYDELDKLLK